MKTRNGIELNLKESIYKASVNKLEFYFSSELYLNKFINEKNLFINVESIKLKNKYKIDIEASLYLLISLYKKIEKRGFFIKDIEKNKEVSENISFKVIVNE